MADIQEIPLDIAEEFQDIVEGIAEAKAEEEPVVFEEVKPVIKPKAKGRPKGSRNLQPSKPRAKKTQIQEAPVEAPVKKLMNLPLRRETSEYPLTQPPLKSQLPC